MAVTDHRPALSLRDLLQLGVIVTFCIMGLWYIALNIEARKTGVALVGHYTGEYESRTSRTKMSSHRNLHLVIEAAIPRAGVKRLPLRETTPAEEIPEAGTAMEVVWVPARPDELRRAATVADVVPLVSVFSLGLAGIFAIAWAWDRRARRRG
jgi:hypothetical protein